MTDKEFENEFPFSYELLMEKGQVGFFSQLKLKVVWTLGVMSSWALCTDNDKYLVGGYGFDNDERRRKVFEVTEKMLRKKRSQSKAKGVSGRSRYHKMKVGSF